MDRIRHRMSDRQLQLFACACSRRVMRLLPDQRCIDLIAAAESFADQDLSYKSLSIAFENHCIAESDYSYHKPNERHHNAVAAAMIAVGVAGGMGVNINFGKINYAELAVSASEWAAMAVALEKSNSTRTELVVGEVSEIETPFYLEEKDRHNALLLHISGPEQVVGQLPEYDVVKRLAVDCYRRGDQYGLLAEQLDNYGYPDGYGRHFRDCAEHPKGCWLLDVLQNRR